MLIIQSYLFHCAWQLLYIVLLYIGSNCQEKVGTIPQSINLAIFVRLNVEFSTGAGAFEYRIPLHALQRACTDIPRHTQAHFNWQFCMRWVALEPA